MQRKCNVCSCDTSEQRRGRDNARTFGETQPRPPTVLSGLPRQQLVGRDHFEDGLERVARHLPRVLVELGAVREDQVLETVHPGPGQLLVF